MHVPAATSAITTIGPITTVNATVHEITGVSWHVLMPYTLLGGGLMIYSQAKLIRGERVMRRQSVPKVEKSSKKARAGLRWFTLRRASATTVAATN